MVRELRVVKIESVLAHNALHLRVLLYLLPTRLFFQIRRLHFLVLTFHRLERITCEEPSEHW